MSAADDARFLLTLAEMADADNNEGEATHLRKIAGQLKNPEVEIVEQQSMTATSRVPDGWSWTDIGPFTGYYSGIRLQKGEPFVEQDGHLLFIRQGETSFTERQRDIYEKSSRLFLKGDDDLFHSAATVLVIHGFQGDRSAFTVFRDGEQRRTEFVEDVRQITDWVANWLKEAHEHPIVRRMAPARKSTQPKLPA